MKRYGFADEANRVIRATLDAAALFDLHRLPEVFFGQQREGESFPVQYIGANSPQAWSSGSIVSFVETLLGLTPDATNHRLYVNPTLADWAPDLRVRGMRIAGACLDLHFWREGAATRFEVEAAEGEPIQVLAGSECEG